MIPREALRVRRYLDGELVDETAIFLDDAGSLAELHADWANVARAAGHVYRVVIDDPAGDIPEVVVLEGAP